MSWPFPQQPRTESTVVAHQSRWGYHPVSREDFLVLKALKKRYWMGVKDAAEWCRWARKKESNRVRRQSVTTETIGPDGEPKLNTVVGITPWPEPKLDEKVFPKKGMQFSGSWEPRPHWFWLDVDARLKRINEDFDKARLPCSSPGDVTPLDMTPYREFLKANP